MTLVVSTTAQSSFPCYKVVSDSYYSNPQDCVYNLLPLDLLFFCSVLCLLCPCVRLFICALWSPAGKDLISWLSFVVSNCEFVTFPIGILGQVWYLIVSIPDLCTLTYLTYIYDGSDLKTYLLMRWHGPDALAVVRPTRVYLLDLFCSSIQFYVLLSPCFCFISLLYLNLYVLGDDAWISKGSFMQTKHLCVLVYI